MGKQQQQQFHRNRDLCCILPALIRDPYDSSILMFLLLAAAALIMLGAAFIVEDAKTLTTWIASPPASRFFGRGAWTPDTHSGESAVIACELNGIPGLIPAAFLAPRP